MNEQERKAWEEKGESGVATSPREAWERVMEWASGEEQATLPDLDYVAESCRATNAELTRLREENGRLEGAVEWACAEPSPMNRYDVNPLSKPGWTYSAELRRRAKEG